jgi:hypothetical protein
MLARAGILMGLLLGLAACTATSGSRSRDPARCTYLFDQYDRATTVYPDQRFSARSGAYVLNPAIEQWVGLLRANRCLTYNDDLDGMEALGESLKPFAPSDSGLAISSTAMHAGIVTSMGAESRAVTFYRSLGYNVRTIGAEQLGRRVFVGPFRTQGALDEAISISQQAGFVSAYPSRYIRY